MRRLAASAVFSLLAAWALPAAATTYLPVPDGQLADQAEAIVAGTVEGRRTIDGPAGFLLTEHTVRVEGVFKGRAWGRIAVRVPGGEREGTAELVWGAPRLAEGERVLLFLRRHGDGSYRPLHLMLGAFHEVAAAGRRLAVPGFAGAAPARDFARFSRWLADRAAGLRRAPDYLVALPAPALRAIGERFTYAGQLRKRWLEFDRLESVGWRAEQGGLAGFPGGGFAELRRALAAWNQDRATNIRYRYDGRTAGGEWRDGNRVDFDDPGDVTAEGSFTCSSPGVGAGILAITKIVFSTQGGEPHPIVRSRVVLNDGAGCWFTTSARLEEVLGHELGHSLGLGHSCGDGTSGPCDAATSEALMRSYAHGDARGARLGADDLAGIFSLYPMRYRALPVPARPSQGKRR
ncbi:MAG TPA: matrixin family metalloprotease [Thermoanaerobaculia bacterium]|nr:matrixin family metalloprotease [Thermoanaerobaculia bacterium]